MQALPKLVTRQHLLLSVGCRLDFNGCNVTGTQWNTAYSNTQIIIPPHDKVGAAVSSSSALLAAEGW
jgi:hypothetical protein